MQILNNSIFFKYYYQIHMNTKTKTKTKTKRCRAFSVESGLLNSDEVNDQHPLQAFHRSNGLLAIKLLTTFLNKHKDKAALIICEFAQTRRRYCSLVH